MSKKKKIVIGTVVLLVWNKNLILQEKINKEEASIPESLGRESKYFDKLIKKTRKGTSAEVKLQAKCDALTKADKEGRVYEAIIGKQVKKKTFMRTVQGNGPSEYSSRITLAQDNNEFSVYSDTMTGIEGRNKYKSILRDVIYNHKDEPNFKNHIYGICGYKNKEGKYMDGIDTLTLIKGEN